METAYADQLPDQFKLVLPLERRIAPARVVWRSDRELGLALTGPWRSYRESAAAGDIQMAEKLNDEDRATALAALPAWKYDEAAGAMIREFKFSSFVDAFGFMTKVALLAERANHHPDWSNVYDRVAITLTDYEAGGLSERDIDLARAVDQLVR